MNNEKIINKILEHNHYEAQNTDSIDRKWLLRQLANMLSDDDINDILYFAQTKL